MKNGHQVFSDESCIWILSEQERCLAYMTIGELTVFRKQREHWRTEDAVVAFYFSDSRWDLLCRAVRAEHEIVLEDEDKPEWLDDASKNEPIWQKTPQAWSEDYLSKHGKEMMRLRICAPCAYADVAKGLIS